MKDSNLRKRKYNLPTKMIKEYAMIYDIDGSIVDVQDVISGVYIIQGFYVGQSIDIVSRISSHMYDAMSDRHPNDLLGMNIKRRMQGDEYLNIHIVSHDIYDEQNAINVLEMNGHDLFNYNSGRVLSQKHSPNNSDKYLRYV